MYTESIRVNVGKFSNIQHSTIEQGKHEYLYILHL